MLHRDHWVLWLGIAGAVIGYLAVSEAPWTWHWDDWMKFLAMVVGIISGKLMTSPLAGEHDATQVSATKTTITTLLLPFIVVGAVASAACKPPASIQTEPGKRAYYAAQVLQRVAELQNLAIQLEATTPPALTTSQARVIVQFCVSAAKVLKDAPEGWAKVVLAAWMETKALLPASVYADAKLVTVFAVLDSLLQTFAGATP